MITLKPLFGKNLCNQGPSNTFPSSVQPNDLILARRLVSPVYCSFLVLWLSFVVTATAGDAAAAVVRGGVGGNAIGLILPFFITTADNTW